MRLARGIEREANYQVAVVVIFARNPRALPEHNSNEGEWAMTKRIRWIAVLVAAIAAGSTLSAATSTSTASPPPRDKAAIEAVLSAQEKAWNAGDLDAFFEGYWRSEELTYAGADGVSRGWNAVHERFKKKYATPQARGKLEFSGLELRSLGPDAAFVLGRWHLTREAGDVGGVFSVIFQRFPEGWKIIHDHTTGVAVKANAG